MDDVQGLDVTGPLDVFAAANDNGAHYRLVTRRAFQRELGIAPSAYRARYRTTGIRDP
jgi:hypothetical protein